MVEENEIIEEVTETEVETIEEVIKDGEVEAVEHPTEPEETTEELEEDDTVIVSIGDSPSPEEEKTEAPQWVKELRKQNREIQRENRELKVKLNINTAETKPATLGEKPTLEESDYDSEEFETKLSKWFEDKRSYDEVQTNQKTEQDNQTKAWQETLTSYGKAKDDLKVRDYEEAEAVVENTLTPTQQGMILQGADNPAIVVYALGKNPKRAKEISEIKDPVKFAFAVAKLESQMKVTNRKTPPAPEKTISGTANISGRVDSTLERLRTEASKTGDYSKVLAYKKSKKTKQ